MVNMMKTDKEYKELSIKEFNKAAEKYESGNAGIYEMCKRDYPPILEEIRKSQCDTKKIISLEDPPEYVLPGVTQVKVQPGHDMDFADALRRVFRQDPDVIFIGEIRDSLTAKVALQAALTGHLVFATLHTGSISQAKLRLINLGESPSLVEEVIKGIISQRLVNGKLEAEIEVSNGK